MYKRNATNLLTRTVYDLSTVPTFSLSFIDNTKNYYDCLN